MTEELKINALFILDIIGKPAEYLLESLERIIKEMEKEKGVSLISKEIKEPVIMGDQKDFYTTFSEIEIEVDNISTLVFLMFKYMPAHVEIISPSMFAMTNNVLNEVLNELVRKLHGYDELSRIMQVEKRILIEKILELGGEIPKGIMPFMELREPWEEEEDSKKS